MLSNDPFVPNVGQFEINIAGFAESRDTTIIAAPIIDANYGVMQDLQVTFVTAYLLSEEGQGFDAFEVSFKWLFYNDDFFSIAINRIYFSYPVATVFNEGDVYKLSVPTYFKVSKSLGLFVDLAYIHPLEEPHHFELGSYLQYSANNHNFYGELFIEESKNHDRLFVLVNFGYLYQLNNNIAFMASIGRELKAEEKNAVISYGGVQFLF